MRTSDQVLAELKGLHPRRIDLSLGRIERLLEKLGHPQNRLPPVIHVAGTNGKGSLTAYLKAMLQAAGRRVHVYTSPHLIRFHERIELAGAGDRAQPIAEAALVDYLTRAEQANAGDVVTFFEITTAAAFLAFAEHPADALILEVGLGGRLDATNVVSRPALSVITPISLDHTEWLGATIDEIAREKAGILKPGVRAVISQQPFEALGAIAACAQAVGAPLTIWGQDYEAFEQRGRLIYQSAEQLMDLPLPALIGQHQIVNAGTAIAAAQHLKALGLGEASSIERGLVEVRWPARMQRLAKGPLAQRIDNGSELWLDGGHNPAGGAAIAQTLGELEERAPKPVGLVLGMLDSKDAAGFLAPFAGLVRHVRTVPIAGTEAAQDATALAGVAANMGLAARPAADVESAVLELMEADAAPIRILICGSLYLAGQVLSQQDGVGAQAD
ncbi:MAG TPA: folylpolyglutamate synthase/dihydrofolate synthase family protein [Hyphomicrobiaceae bacterium]|nr:folylpolyglutamate synthase/dihydrofolate synthase family protein [Hyphomicrobiaceae bacterium]